MQDLDEVFGPHGPLMRSLPGFTPRRAQLAMATRVARALDNRAPLVVEAGTGTGKTFAYLVPALLSGKRVLISTGTRTLQDQLFNKDLPLVAGAIGRPASVALLKGRSNYLCHYRLKQLDTQRSLPGTRDRMLARVQRWAGVTAQRRPGRGAGSRRCASVVAAGHLHPRQLSRRALCRHRPLSRGRGAPPRHRSGHRHRESPSAARGPGAQGRGLRRPAGRGGRGDHRRGTPDPGSRHAILRRPLRQPPGGTAGARCAPGAGAGPRRRDRARRPSWAAVEKGLAALAEILRGTQRPDWLAADTPLADASPRAARRRCARWPRRSTSRDASPASPNRRRAPPSSPRACRKSPRRRNTRARAASS